MITSFIKSITYIAYRSVNSIYNRNNIFLSTIWISTLIFFCIVILLILLLLPWRDIQKVNELNNYRPPLPSRLLDRKGRLITTFFRDHRIMIDFDQIPKHLLHTFIAMEDNHFYDHLGFDIQAVLRAFIANLQSGNIRQGGSTITQQLAKVILTDRSRTYSRKFKEIFLSVLIEMIHSKNDILRLYFNQIYFGHGNYGVEAASRFYFKKSITDINIGEAAILASLPAAPNRYSPIKNPKLSLRRITHVFLKMIDMNFITRAEAVKEFENILTYYKNLNVAPTYTAYGLRQDKAPFFTELIRKKLENQIGKKALYNEGLTIHSSLDLDHQRIAQETLWDALEKQNEISRKYIFAKHSQLAQEYSHVLGLMQLAFDLPEFKIKRNLAQYKLWLNFHKDISENLEILNLGMGGDKYLDSFLAWIRADNPFQNRYLSVQGAFVEIDHKTGEITAMVGGSKFHSQNQINRTMQIKRQPGSTFKALIYASALETQKVTPATIFPDSPVVFLDQEGDNWIPENYSGGYRGFINLRDALAYSANMVSIAVTREVSLRNILSKIAASLRVPKANIPFNLSLALGTYEVSPMQMTHAFSLFPRGGKDIDLVYYTKITDSKGEVIKEVNLNKKYKSIFKPSTASIMTSMLQDVVSKGTGVKVRTEGGYHGFAAGKTGTTQNYKDAWFVGFNKRYTSSLWIGYDRSVFSLGTGQAGGNVAAPVWGKYQRKLEIILKENNKKENDHFIQGKVTKAIICKATGKQYNANCFCNETYEEIFAPDTIPDNSCDTVFEENPEFRVFDSLENNNKDQDDFFKDDDI